MKVSSHGITVTPIIKYMQSWDRRMVLSCTYLDNPRVIIVCNSIYVFSNNFTLWTGRSIFSTIDELRYWLAVFYHSMWIYWYRLCTPTHQQNMGCNQENSCFKLRLADDNCSNNKICGSIFPLFPVNRVDKHILTINVIWTWILPLSWKEFH